MKNRIAEAVVFAVVISITLFLAGPAQAQNIGMRMEVPVPFVAGDTILPAGTYVVSVDEKFRLVHLRGQDVDVNLMLAKRSAQRPAVQSERGLLRLNQYGDSYVLRDIWKAGATEGWSLVRSEREVELAKAHPIPTLTTIAAK